MTNQYYDPTTAEYFNPELTRRVAIVTGGNSGLGWFTVLHLYLHGYIVYVAGRTESKVLKAIEDIKSEANTRIEKYSQAEKVLRFVGSLQYVHFDCCDLKSVERCATTFLENEPKLHLLINNAGVMAVPFELTKDNYEIQYQVNFVAPLLFTLKLLPAIKAAETDTTPRVVTLSSIGHYFAARYYEPEDHMNGFPLLFYSFLRYSNAKSAVVQFTKKFAEKYPDILAFSVHPGVITETQLFNPLAKLPYFGWLLSAGTNLSGYFMGVSPEEGSLATLRAAMDKSFSKKDSGLYLLTGGAVTTPSSIALNIENINTTWNKNLEMLNSRNFHFKL